MGTADAGQGQASGPPFKEPDDLGQLVKLSGFGFLPSEMGAIIYPCRAVVCKEQKERKCGKHPAPYLAAALV